MAAPTELFQHLSVRAVIAGRMRVRSATVTQYTPTVNARVGHSGEAYTNITQIVGSTHWRQ